MKKKEKLSAHFSVDDFMCHGEKCCSHTTAVHPYLICGLEEMHRMIRTGICILSGFRCRKHNAEIGGSANSLHTRGMAADINVKGLSPELLAVIASKIQAFTHGGIGIYSWGIHVDIGPERRWKG